MKNKYKYTLALLFACLQAFAQTYTYDNLNRLTKVVYDNGTTITYGFDALGNRTSKKVTGATSATESYAWLSSDGKTLTFCYDNERSKKSGETYSLNSGSNYPAWNSNPSSTVSSVTKVVFNSTFSSVKPTSTYAWFYNFQNLKEITGLNYLNTSSVTDLSNMFRNCKSLTSLNLSNFNTSKAINMAFLFYSCSGLTSLNVGNFNTSNVNNMEGMFAYCRGLTNLDLSALNTSKVTKFNYMFQGCSSLTNLDVSNFDMTSHANSNAMFKNCTSLNTLSISSGMSVIDNTACEGIGTSSAPCVINAPKGFNFGVETSGSYFLWKSGYFKTTGTTAQKETYVWLSSDGKTLTFCNDNERSKKTGETYSLNSGSNNPAWNANPSSTVSSVTKVVFNSTFSSVRPTSTYSWFYNFQNLKEITGLSYLNTSDVTNMNSMFRDCRSLTNLNLNSFNTSKVTNMAYMFSGCSNMTSLDVSSFNTSNVTNFSYMFQNCTSLSSLDVSNFDMSKHTSSSAMFRNCSALNSLDISSGMDIIDDGACDGIGSSSSPCVINAPDGFNFGVSTSASSFRWKSGYFKVEGATPSTGAYAWLSSDGETLTFCYDNERSERVGETYNLNSGSNNPAWNTNPTSTVSTVTKVVFNSTFSQARPTSTYSWFNNFQNLKEIVGINNLNTSEVTNAQRMFRLCKNLSSLDLSRFNTAKVTDMAYMFYACGGLRTLDVSKLNTANVTNMEGMFGYCRGLNSLDLSSFNTANVTNFKYMFLESNYLKRLDVSNFDMSKQTNSVSMFKLLCLQTLTIN